MACTSNSIDVDVVLSLLSSTHVKIEPAKLAKTLCEKLVSSIATITSTTPEVTEESADNTHANNTNPGTTHIDANQDSTLLENLTLYVTLLDKASCLKDTEADLFHQTMHEFCLPLLTSGILHGKGSHAALFGKTTAVLRLCYPFLRYDSREEVEKLCTDSMSQYVKDKKSQYGGAEILQAEVGKLPILVVIELVVQILTAYADGSNNLQLKHSWLMEITELVQGCLKVTDQRIAGCLVSTLIPKILHAVPDLQQNLLHQFWQLTVSLFNDHGQKTFKPVDSGFMSQEPHLILCGLADFFFPISVNITLQEQLEHSASFWRILQSGFYHSDLLTRKRSMYLLKRILDMIETRGAALDSSSENDEPVFWWHPDDAKQLTPMWNDYILLMETLEETQVHVIKPLMPRFHQLVEQSAVQIKGCPLIHTSWLTTIIQRAASHESSYIKRWGIHQMLAVDLGKCPLMKQQGGQNFMTDTLVTMLSEAAVYYKAVGGQLGELNPGGVVLNQFFLSCFNALAHEDRAPFFTRFIHGIKQQMWGESALFYVSQGLSHLPSVPLLGPEALKDMRDIIIIASTFKHHCRGAIQSFLLTFVINTANLDMVDPMQFAAFLSSLSRDECLQRGTPEWTQAMEIFSNVSAESKWKPDALRSHISTLVDNLLKVNVQDGGGEFIEEESLPLVRLLLLVCDAGYLQQTDADGNASVLDVILQPVISVLMSVNTHAYMPAAKAHRALSFFITLLQEATSCSAVDDLSNADSVKHSLSKLASLLSNDVLLFLQTRLDENKQLSDFLTVDLYVDCLRKLIFYAPEKSITSPFFAALLKKCVDRIGEPDSAQVTIEMQVRRYTAMRMLASFHPAFQPAYQHLVNLDATVKHFFDTWVPSGEFKKPASGLSSDFNSQLGSKRQQDLVAWGKLSCDYLGAQWRCIEYLVLRRQEDVSVKQISTYHEQCLSMLDLVSFEGYSSVLQCLHLLLPKLDDELSSMAINEVWRRVGTLRRNVQFWPVFEQFVCLAFQPALLECDQESKAFHALLDCAKGIFHCGEERNGVVTLVAQQLFSYIESKVGSFHHLHKFIDLIIDLLIFGPIHSKSNKTAQEVLQYIDSLGDQLSVNKLLLGQLRCDNMVQVYMLTMLSYLQSENTEHATFVAALVPRIIHRFRDLRKIKTYRNFSNSLGHRVKHRLMCGLVLLHQHYSENLDGLIRNFCEEILLKENQTSIRSMSEWILILQMHKTMALEWIWSGLQVVGACEKNGACTCSILMIVFHLAKLIQEKSVQESFILKAIQHVMPLTMVVQLNVRTFAQGTLYTLWEIAQENGLEEVVQKHSILQSFTDVHKSSGIYKSMSKLLSNFWMVFHPLEDLSLQTICRTLPWLTGIVDEEWLSPKLFLQVTKSWLDMPSLHCLPLVNSRQVLDSCQPGSWRIKAGPGDDADDTKDGDVQKKMMPWRLMLPEADLGLDLEEDYSKKKQRMGGLILVTSLIDKIPNLGGLCRTCEIFGVSEYVIGSLKFMEDKQFEYLSVSAHKWLPITEVKAALLKNYLWEMKQEGYTLVGAEQTANSTSLVDYKFPKKTLLLLGNEREGIPVDLIQLLDMCVEIPQLGVTRSLNVHVSGALLIWEYARQHLTH